MVLASFARPLADGPSFALLIRSSIDLDVRRAISISAEHVTKLDLLPLRLCFLLLARNKRNDRGYHRNRDVGPCCSRCLSFARELESSGRVMTRGQQEPRTPTVSRVHEPRYTRDYTASFVTLYQTYNNATMTIEHETPGARNSTTRLNTTGFELYPG